MGPDVYVADMLINERQQMIQQAGARQRLLLSLPRQQRQDKGRHFAGRPGRGLIMVGMWLEQLESREHHAI